MSLSHCPLLTAYCSLVALFLITAFGCCAWLFCFLNKVSEGWGLVVFTQSFAFWLGMIVEYGFHLSGTRLIARSRGDEEEIAAIVAGEGGIQLVDGGGLGSDLSHDLLLRVFGWWCSGLLPRHQSKHADVTELRLLPGISLNAYCEPFGCRIG